MPKKEDISLLTLLAYDSTNEARALLRKYGKPDAKNKADLENKLAQLYFESPDKKYEIEKAMAEIHPHKTWLLKYVMPKVNKVDEEIKKVTSVKNAPSHVHCDCPQCEQARQNRTEQSSSAEGGSQMPRQQNESLLAHFQHMNNQTLIAMVGVIGIVALVSLHLNKKA